MNKSWRLPVGLGAGGFGGFLMAMAGGLFSPMIGFFAVLGAACAAAMFFWVDFAFLLSVVVIPIERLGRFADDSKMPVVSLMRIVGTIALASFLLHAVLRRWRVFVNVPLLLYTGYVSVCIATIFYAPIPEAARVHAATVTGNLLFLFLVVNAARDWSLIQKAVFAWVGVTVAIGLFQIYDWHFGGIMDADQLGTVGNRFSMTWNSVSEANLGAVRQAAGTSSGAATYGINLLMVLPFLLWSWRVARQRWQVVLTLGALLVILYNLMLTNTRAVMVFVVLCLGFCLLKRLLAVTPHRLLLGLAAGAVGLYLLPSAVWQRALSLENYLPQNSYNLRGRFELWKGALRVIEEYWLTGVGGANWWILPKYLHWEEADTELIMSHNEYLQTFIDAGIVGWLFFVSFLALTFWYSLTTARRIRASEGENERYWFMVACQITLVTVYLFGLQVDVFHFPLKGWWFVAGLSCVMYRMHAGQAAERTAPSPDPELDGSGSLQLNGAHGR